MISQGIFKALLTCGTFGLGYVGFASCLKSIDVIHPFYNFTAADPNTGNDNLYFRFEFKKDVQQTLKIKH